MTAPNTKDSALVSSQTPTQAESLALRAAIRGMGKDPECRYTSIAYSRPVAEVRLLNSSEKRAYLLRLAVRYLIGVQSMTDGQVDSILGAPGSRIVGMASLLTSHWREEVRERTWIDDLSPEDQAEYVVRRKAYKLVVDEQQRVRDAARAAYERALTHSFGVEKDSRDELTAWIASRGAKLPTRPSATERMMEGLSSELQALRVAGIPVPDLQPVAEEPFSQATATPPTAGSSRSKSKTKSSKGAKAPAARSRSASESSTH